MPRRDLLKLAGIGMLTLAGCSKHQLVKAFVGDWNETEEQGFRKFWEVYHILDEPPKDYDHVVKIKDLDVHMCSLDVIKNTAKDRYGYKNWNSIVGLGGKKELWAPVTKINGKVFPNRAVLGHEFYNTIRANDRTNEIFDVYKYKGLK